MELRLNFIIPLQGITVKICVFWCINCERVRAQWSRGLECGPGAACLLGLFGLWVRIPTGASVLSVANCQLEISASD